MHKVFINGSSGTTGLRLNERMKARDDVQLINISDKDRKDPAAVRDCMAESDITFLCLPDDAAKEAVALSDSLSCRILDTSTAHRTLDGWTYGFPELSTEQRDKISSSSRVAVPGCHASGFISLIQPLVSTGILPSDYPLTCLSLTGYSGAGKTGIAQYQAERTDPLLGSPREYALSQSHKHLPEIVKLCNLDTAPVFMPVIADFYSGMLVTVPIHTKLLSKPRRLSDFCKALAEQYKESKLITVEPTEPDGMLASNALSGKDDLIIYVTGNDERVMLHALFDNLGKGASGAALQCFNIMVGADEKTGLNLYSTSK